MFNQYHQAVILIQLVSHTFSVSQSDFFSQSVRLCHLISQTLSVSSVRLCQFHQSVFASQSFSLCQLVIQTLLVSQSDFASQSVRLCYLFSQTLIVSQSDFDSQSVRLCQFHQSYFVSYSVSQSYSFPVSKTDFIQFFTTTLYILTSQDIFFIKKIFGEHFFHKKAAKIFSFLKAINSRQRKEYGC